MVTWLDILTPFIITLVIGVGYFTLLGFIFIVGITGAKIVEYFQNKGD